MPGRRKYVIARTIDDTCPEWGKPQKGYVRRTCRNLPGTKPAPIAKPEQPEQPMCDMGTVSSDNVADFVLLDLAMKFAQIEITHMDKNTGVFSYTGELPAVQCPNDDTIKKIFGNSPRLCDSDLCEKLIELKNNRLINFVDAYMFTQCNVEVTYEKTCNKYSPHKFMFRPICKIAKK